MKSRKGPSPKRKVSHTKWKHRQTQNSVAKHIKAEKLQARLHFLFGFWQDQELSWEKLERMKVYRAWYLCDQEERGCRHRSSTKKARDEQGKAAPMPYLSALLQPAHAALCCSSPGINGQNTITIGSILLPKNPNHTWKKQALSSTSENTMDFYPPLPLLLCQSHKYSTWALKSSRFLRRHWVKWNPKRHFRQI